MSPRDPETRSIADVVGTNLSRVQDDHQFIRLTEGTVVGTKGLALLESPLTEVDINFRPPVHLLSSSLSGKRTGSPH